MKKILAFVVFATLLAACGPSAQALATHEAEVIATYEAAHPTAEPTAVPTPKPTAAPVVVCSDEHIERLKFGLLEGAVLVAESEVDCDLFAISLDNGDSLAGTLAVDGLSSLSCVYTEANGARWDCEFKVLRDPSAPNLNASGWIYMKVDHRLCLAETEESFADLCY